MKGTWKYERVIWEKRKSLNKNDLDQVFWARETEPPTKTLVFTKTGGRQPGWGYCYLRSSREKGAETGKRPFLFPVSSRLILAFALSQFSGLDFLSRSLEQTKMRPEGRKKYFETAPHLSQGLIDQASPLSEGLDTPLFKLGIYTLTSN